MNLRINTAIMLAGALLLSACQGNSINDNVAMLNAAATRAAGGDPGLPAGVTATPSTPTPSPEPTAPPNLYDLTANPSALLVQAWGPIYGLESGQNFSVIATQEQVSDFVVRYLQESTIGDIVQGGSVTIASGQMRLDVALIDADENFGAGTVTFQPTLDGTRLRLNPLGASFGSLNLPGTFTQVLGDAASSALTGAANATLSEVTLTRLTLENGIMTVEGTTTR